MTNINDIKKDINESCRLAREMVLFLEKETKGNSYIAEQAIVILHAALIIERKKRRNNKFKDFFGSDNYGFAIGFICLIVSIIYVLFKLPN